MDSYKLHQEANDLQKVLEETMRKQKVSEEMINNLHKEQMQYLKDIPVFRKQADDDRKLALEASKNLNTLSIKVSALQKEYSSLQNLIVESKDILDELTTTKAKVIKETNSTQESIKNSHASLIDRERIVKEKEEDVFHKEEFNKKILLSLDKREVEIENKEKELTLKVDDLKKKIDEHNSHVELHGKKVDTLIEQKQFLREDQQDIRNKTEAANKLIKDNTDIKSAMLKQSEKMDAEIKKAEQKQYSLDKAINDLKNEEKRIKILELKVMKMVKDANLEKELRDLMESLK